MPIGDLVLISLVAAAVYFDLLNRKIPNFLNFFGIIVGLSLALFGLGRLNIWMSIFGMIIPFVLLFVLFVMKVIGAGDIKLYCAIGTLVGMKVVYIIGGSFVIGAIAGIGEVIRKLRTGNMSEIFVFRKRICFSIPIAIATVVFIAYEYDIESMLKKMIPWLGTLG